MSDDILLAASGLGKSYVDGERELAIIKDLNFEINAGEQLAILGQSGSGKTTLLQLLAGLAAPSSGSVKLRGQDLNSLKDRELCKLRNSSIGFVYQFHHLLPEFSALENVMLPILLSTRSSIEARLHAEYLLDRVGLADRISHKPWQLSGGERQRVAIARALANSPDCVLADEPTGNLDRDNSAKVLQLLLELNREHKSALIIVTHDLDLSQKLDRQVILQDGRFVSSEP